MTATLSAHRTRSRSAARSQPAPDAAAALVLEQAASRARRQPSVSTAVRAAWDVLVTSDITGLSALAAWGSVLGCERPDETVFPAACLAASSPGDVAGSLYRAARGAMAA